MSCKRLTLAATGALALTGCAQTWSTSAGEIEDADFGEANRQTFAAMVIDPEPVYTEELMTSGDHAQQAIERYRTDQVKQPERVRTGTPGGDAEAANAAESGGN
jgi:type IV pilus biogenesis protein CpaD/CtpE